MNNKKPQKAMMLPADPIRHPEAWMQVSLKQAIFAESGLQIVWKNKCLNSCPEGLVHIALELPGREQ